METETHAHTNGARSLIYIHMVLQQLISNYMQNSMSDNNPKAIIMMDGYCNKHKGGRDKWDICEYINPTSGQRYSIVLV